MFQIGIFTTHLPYIILVVFYLVSLVMNKSEGNEAQVKEVLLCCDENHFRPFDSNTSAFFKDRADSSQYKDCKQALADFLTDASFILKTPLLAGPPHVPQLWETHLYSTLSNRPPPQA